jgi:hypothetical protein
MGKLGADLVVFADAYLSAPFGARPMHVRSRKTLLLTPTATHGPNGGSEL